MAAGATSTLPENELPLSTISRFDSSTEKSACPSVVRLTRQFAIVVDDVPLRTMPESQSVSTSPASINPEHRSRMTAPFGVANLWTVEFDRIQSAQSVNRIVPGRENCRGLNVFPVTTTR